MSDVMMALGPYRFSISTAALQSLDRIAEYRWADHDVVGAKPRSHFIGPGLNEIELSGTIYPFYRGGFDQVEQMRLIAGKGEPLRLVDGLGRDLKLWSIRRVVERQQELFVYGVPRKVEFEISIKEYSDG